MPKAVYASGFLYNLKNHKILLIQSKQKDDKILWSMLGGESVGKEQPLEAFQRVVKKILGLDLKAKKIYPIYDYFNDTISKDNFVFYAEVKSLPNFDSKGEDSFTWIGFSETPKLPFTPHTKQDIIVGERVINLKWRLDQNLQ